MNLKQHQIDLLRYLVEQRGPVPADTLDGRNLRPLRALGLVADVGASVTATVAGRSHVSSGGVPTPQAKLTEQQEQVLRYLLRQTGPVPVDHLDGRVLRALVARGLAAEDRGWASPTDRARGQLTEHSERQRVGRRRRETALSGRAETIRRALDELESALPKDAEVLVSGVPMYADDVVAALRKFVKQLEVRTDKPG